MASGTGSGDDGSNSCLTLLDGLWEKARELPKKAGDTYTRLCGDRQPSKRTQDPNAGFELASRHRRGQSIPDVRDGSGQEGGGSLVSPCGSEEFLFKVDGKFGVANSEVSALSEDGDRANSLNEGAGGYGLNHTNMPKVPQEDPETRPALKNVGARQGAKEEPIIDAEDAEDAAKNNAEAAEALAALEKKPMQRAAM